MYGVFSGPQGYEEKLLVDLVTDSKRTNKNQRISCPPNIKTLPLQSKEKEQK